MSVALSLVGCLTDNPKGLADFLRLALSAYLFHSPEEQNCFKILNSYVLKYGAIPPKSEFAAQGITIPAHCEHPVDYYADQLQTRHTHFALKQTVYDVQELLNADKPHAAQQIMMENVLNLTQSTYKKKLVNFAQQGHDIIFDEIKAKKLQGADYGIKFGWPTLDGMADGLIGGDVICIVGRPGQGKTYAMLYTASNAWNKQNKSVMFVSMEMKNLPIAQRLAAINAKKPITAIKKAELSTAMEKSLSYTLLSFKDKNDFWLVDGALAATVDDIILMARQLKPEVIWIDGAYLVKGGKNSRQQRWDRITEVLERLKGELAEALDVPVVISFQFNRQQKKGINKDDALGNIAYADAVGQLCSVVLGMGLTDNEDSVESLYKRRIEVLKGRSGEVGEFEINWIFDTPGPNFMDFTEVKKATQEDMVFGME